MRRPLHQRLGSAESDIAVTDAGEEPTGKAPNRAKGGRKGAKVRAKVLSPQERSEIARAAASARWKKG